MARESSESYAVVEKSRQGFLESIIGAVREFGVFRTVARGFEYGAIRTPGVQRLYWRFIPIAYRKKYSSNLNEYEYPPDPFKLIWIDPNESTHFTGRGTWDDWTRFDVGSVIPGKWDRVEQQELSKEDHRLLRGETIQDTLIYEALEKRLFENVDWTETEFYQETVDRVQSMGKSWHNFRSEDDVRDRCEYLDEIAESIVTKGYKTQAQLRDHSPSLSDPRGFGFFNERTNEITVDIGREGELLLVDNRHRLMISQILDLDSVPATVAARHPDWMHYRDRIAREKIESDHQDLEDLQHQCR